MPVFAWSDPRLKGTFNNLFHFLLFPFLEPWMEAKAERELSLLSLQNQIRPTAADLPQAMPFPVCVIAPRDHSLPKEGTGMWQWLLPLIPKLLLPQGIASHRRTPEWTNRGCWLHCECFLYSLETIRISFSLPSLRESRNNPRPGLGEQFILNNSKIRFLTLKYSGKH